VLSDARTFSQKPRFTISIPNRLPLPPGRKPPALAEVGQSGMRSATVQLSFTLKTKALWNYNWLILWHGSCVLEVKAFCPASGQKTRIGRRLL